MRGQYCDEEILRGIRCGLPFFFYYLIDYIGETLRQSNIFLSLDTVSSQRPRFGGTSH